MGASKSSTYIEETAVDKLSILLRNTGRIKPDIAIQDRGISWDGALYYYDSKEKYGTKDIAGRIPVQVKGTTSKVIRNGMLRFTGVSLTHLKNYKIDGGCLFFVICQTGHGDEYFYEILLPYDLEKILSKERKSNAKTTTLYLSRLPLEESSLLALMHSFLTNREKQVSTVKHTFDVENPDNKAKALLHDMNENGIGPFTFSLSGTRDNPIGSSFDIPTYFYANTPYGIEIPIKRAQIGSITMGNLPYAVYIDGVKYYDNVQITRSKGKEIVTIGKSISIDLPRSTNTSNENIRFKESGYMSERIKDNEFWLAAISSGSHRIICNDLFDGSVNIPHDLDLEQKINDRLEYLRSISSVLVYFGVNDELDISELTEKDWDYLEVLSHASQGEELSLPAEESPFVCITLCNLEILVYIERLENGKRKLHNLFNMPKCDFTFTVNEETLEASPCLMLSQYNLVNSSNVNYETIYESLTSFPFSSLYGRVVNLFLLGAICAYDDKTTDNLLHLIDRLSMWILENECSEISRLNRMQVIKRQRGFTLDEQKSLRSISATSENSINKIGACILLESFVEARTLWDTLTEPELEDLKKRPYFPIHNLWMQDKPDIDWLSEDNSKRSAFSLLD